MGEVFHYSLFDSSRCGGSENSTYYRLVQIDSLFLLRIQYGPVAPDKGEGQFFCSILPL